MTHRRPLRIQRSGLIDGVSERVTRENGDFTPSVGLNSMD
jgi:hypothetical protein